MPEAVAPLTIHITERAAKKVAYFADKDRKGEEFGLRVGVKGGGCSGLTYTLSVEAGPQEDDKVIVDQGIRLFVPKKSFVFLAGTELDFSDGLNGKGFTFVNPNAKSTCGCGTSFSV
ncbi:MAG: iron-sulfur cluster assembly accessory protein [Chloroflexi bacterium]|nr:iron-sulfur cluster assembly accessory protein [Chloroflexota bacterium]